MSKIKAVIFDLGGTLLHYNDSETDDQDRHFRRVTISGIKNVYRHLLKTTGLAPVEDFAAVIDRHVQHEMSQTRDKLLAGSIEKPIRSALSEVGAALDDEQWQALRRRARIHLIAQARQLGDSGGCERAPVGRAE